MAPYLSKIERSQLLQCASLNDVAGMKALVYRIAPRENCTKSKIIASVSDEELRTVIHTAAQSGAEDALKYSLRSGDWANERALLQYSVDRKDIYGKTALQYAAATGDRDIAKQLLSAGAAVSLADSEGRNVLHHAVLGGHTKTVEFLLRTCVDDLDIDGQTLNGQTCLHLAARKNDASMAQWLIDEGIDSSIEDKDGRTAKEVAKGCRATKVLYVLGEKGPAPVTFDGTFRSWRKRDGSGVLKN